MFPNGISFRSIDALVVSLLLTALCTLLHEWNIGKATPAPVLIRIGETQ